MSDDDKEKPISVSSLASELLQRLLGREALMLLAVCIFVAGVTLYATHALGQTVDHRVDAGLQRTKQQVDDLEAKFDMHIKDAAAERRALTEDLHEVQMDIRALYKVVQTGERSARLERPLPTPDGGM